MKAVHNFFEQNTKVGILAGMIGGMYKYILLQMQSDAFIITMTKAGLTALVCGLAGVAGKEIYSFLKVRITIVFKSKK